MHSKVSAFWMLINVIFITGTLISCSFLFQGPSSDELLEQLGVDAQYFAALPTCEQIRLFSYLSPYFPSVHSIEARPTGYPWMTEILYRRGQEVAPCIIKEGSLRLNEKSQAAKWRVLGLSILIENLELDYLASKGVKGADFNFPEAQDYLYQVICSPNSTYQPEATRAFYMAKLRSFPRDAFEPPSVAQTPQGIQKMKETLCR